MPPFCKDTGTLSDIFPICLLIYKSKMILHYCYKVNQDFNGTVMLLPRIFYYFFLTIMYVFNELIMQCDNDFTNYKVITVSLMGRNFSFLSCRFKHRDLIPREN